ncbi:MAG: hypothetical protein ACOCV1_05435 [Bacillota bacterium]
MERTERKEKIINYIKKIYPTKLNTGEEINLEGFGIAFGNLAGNNPLFSDFAKDIETHTINSLEDIKNQTETSKNIIHLADEMDQYYTPNFFPGTVKSHRDKDNVMWLNALYVDIDGIKGVYDYRKGLHKLYKACDKAEIPYPDIVLKTSVNPTVHLQALWLIDPVYIKDKFNQKKNEKNKEWWISANSSLSYVLSQADNDLQLDSAVTTDIARYMRLPYTYNQKTGELTEIIEDRITEERHLLQDDWVKNIMNKYFTRDYSYNYKKNYVDVDDIEILDHPQFKAILQGVPKDYRNFAHYALIKAYEVTGYTKKETYNKILEFNKRCKPQEKISQIKSVMCAYGNGSGIDIGRIAEVATNSFGEGEFNPDPALLRLFNIMQGTLKRNEKVYNNNKGIEDKVIPLLRGFVKAGNKYLPNMKELAEMLSIKYHSLTKHFKEIKSQLQRYNLYINYDYSQKKYRILTYAELIKFAFERKKEEEECLEKGFRFIHNLVCQISNIVLSRYEAPFPFHRDYIFSYINELKRGSPKLE